MIRYSFAHGSSHYLRAHNLHIIQRFFSLVGLQLVYLANRLNPLDHSSKDGVFVIEPRTCYHCYEELRAIGVGPTISHSQHIRLIESVLLRSKLILKHAAPNGLSAGSIALRTTSLVHETLDHSVEDHPVVVTLLHELNEVFAGLRAIFKVKVKMNVATRGLKDYLVLLLDCLGEICDLVLFTT